MVQKHLKVIKYQNHEKVFCETMDDGHHSFGKFSHALDDLVTKGFRRHELTLQDGTEVVVYNMHMDASDPRDIRLGNEAKDRDHSL